MKTLIAACCLLSLPAFAIQYFEDSLTAASAPGRGQRGGSYGPDGWTITAEDDTIWYEIPAALPSARIEFTVTGLSIGPGGTLSGADHDILTIYQAPDGMAEPVAYSPGFRNNDFKGFIRIFGNQETSRPGAVKLELAACPRGAPWYHDTACPAGCGIDGIGYANGGQSPGWDPATSYRIALEWGNGVMSFSRNGAVLGTVPYPGTYAPQPLRIRFGSPRHQGVYPGAAMMPLGITFKDILITGTPGQMTPICGSAPTGGGAGGGTGGGSGGGSTGTGGGGGSSVPGELAALQDVTAANWESGVFPDVGDLNVEGPGGVVFLRFPATSGVVDRATLVLHTQSSSSAAGGSGSVCAVADNTWSETTLTWANRPTTGACVGPARSVTSNAEVEWDVTSLVQGGRVTNLALVSNDPDGAHYLSKESGGAGQGPRLRIVEHTVVDAGTVEPPVDAGTAEIDAGAPPVDAGVVVTDAGTQSDAGTTVGGPPGSQPNFGGIQGTAVGGCGCQGGGSISLLLGVLALLRRRR